MLSIEKLFENHLDNRQISSEELRQFAEDHIARLNHLTSAPAAILALIAASEAVFEEFDGALSVRATLIAEQAGGTITKNEALQLLRTTVRQREGRIRDKLGKGSGPYAEFFPAGLLEYSRARLGQVNALLDRLITAADKYKTTLGPELLAEFTALKNTFATARDGQLDSKGELAAARAAVATTRTPLELQLGRNMLAIASHHLGEPERAKDYFNQSLLEDPTRNNEDPPAPQPSN